MLMIDKEYNDMYRSEEELWWYKGLRQIMLRELKKYLKKEDQVLDAGCGTGKNMEVLLNEGYTVTGVDLSEDAIKYCLQRGLKSVSQGDISQLDFYDNTFNALICMDVLGLVDGEGERKAVLKEFYRVLNRDGIFIINSAALEALRSQHDDVCNLKRRFKKSELEKALIDAGFEIVKSTYRVFLLFIPLASIKIVKRLLNSSPENAKSDQIMPPKIFNWLLTQIMSLEHLLLQLVRFPIGTSVFIVAKKVA
jgi:ubiquinone/menaquinone biosynthesis C-methylase UbiE